MCNRVFRGVDCFGRDTLVATRDGKSWYAKTENGKWFVPNASPVLEGDSVLMNFRSFQKVDIRVCLPHSIEEKIETFYTLKSKLRNNLNFKPLKDVIESNDYKKLVNLAKELKAKRYTKYSYVKIEVDPIRLVYQSYIPNVR